VIRARVNDPSDAHVRLEKAAPPVVALDPGEVALQHRRVVDRVIVRDSAQNAEKLGALVGRELVLDVARVDGAHADDVHGVDRRPPFRNRRAARTRKCQGPQESAEPRRNRRT